MSLYEHIFIARQDISTQQVENLTEQFSAIISDNGGSVTKTEQWGLRTMAYRIKKNRKGHYTLLNIDAPHAAVAEMERQQKLNEDVLRILTLRVDAHEEGPSAMLANKNRDGRDGRDGRGPRGSERSPRGERSDRGPRGDRDGSSQTPFRARPESPAHSG